MSDHAEVVLTAGLFHPEIKLTQLYELSTKVMHDGVVTELRRGNRLSVVEAVKAMTPAERLALRERVTGVVRIKSRSESPKMEEA